ncbi:MAG: EcsC family protein [Deltaproteobacteria bacterium]|nr:EcsC family protein [Deltaproteobacteria bacterium]
MSKKDMTNSDLNDLGRAKALLENPSFAVKAMNMVGSPIEKGLKLLPANWSEKVQVATRTALDKALHVAIGTMRPSTEIESSDAWHKVAVGLSGALGGAFGLPALVVELPVTTTIMLRSIAEIARSKGEDPRSPETAMACMEVFALGGPTTSDDASESGYFAVRMALAKAVSEAASFIAEKGLVEEGAPVLVRLIASIAARFGVVVGEKAAAQIVPVIGAAGGAAVNVAFMDHFQDMAEGHFTVRHLERKYGAEMVRAAYDRLPR